MDREVLIAQNKAAEAEAKRVSAMNKLNMLDRQAGEMVMALREALLYIGGTRDYKDSEVAALKNMIKAAMAVYTSNAMVVSDAPVGFQLFAQDPPEDPQTDDWYWDGKNLHWYYLGRWHRERLDE